MKLYRMTYGGKAYGITDQEDGTPVLVTEIDIVNGIEPLGPDDVYRVLNMLDLWRKAGKPGEILKEDET